MAFTAVNTVVPAANIDTIVDINGSKNKIKEFVRAGAIRIINNQYIYVGGADMVGTMTSNPAHVDWALKGYPMRASYPLAPAYDEVQIGGTWMKMIDAAKNGL
jgi:hypothetical protein